MSAEGAAEGPGTEPLDAAEAADAESDAVFEEDRLHLEDLLFDGAQEPLIDPEEVDVADAEEG